MRYKNDLESKVAALNFRSVNTSVSRSHATLLKPLREVCNVTTKITAATNRAENWEQANRQNGKLLEERGVSNFVTFFYNLLTWSVWYDFIFQGYTAVHLAVIQGHESIMASLLDCGTKISLVTLFFVANYCAQWSVIARENEGGYIDWFGVELSAKKLREQTNVLRTSKCQLKLIFPIYWPGRSLNSSYSLISRSKQAKMKTMTTLDLCAWLKENQNLFQVNITRPFFARFSTSLWSREKNTNRS